jgi:hypothetical protein
VVDGPTKRQKRPLEAGDQRPDELQVSLTVGSEESPPRREARAVFGEATPETFALADALRARETELTEWLQDPANRERLLMEPREALAEVLPEEALRSIKIAPSVAAELRERLQELDFRVYSPPKTPAMELFEKLWAWVAAAPGNLTAFNADVPGTVRSVDPAAPETVVEEVVSAIQTAQGIPPLVSFEVVAPTQFARTVSTTLPESWLGRRP